MSKKFVWIFLGFSLLGILGGGLYTISSTGYSPSPELEMTLLDGNTLTLNSLRGQPVLVYFWATTCVSCIEEIPQLIALFEEYASQGLKIVGVAMYYDPPNRILQFSKMYHLPYPIALDLQGTIAQNFGGIQFTPTHLLVNPEGKLVYSHQGKLQMTVIKQQIKQLLNGFPQAQIGMTFDRASSFPRILRQAQHKRGNPLS